MAALFGSLKQIDLPLGAAFAIERRGAGHG